MLIGENSSAVVADSENVYKDIIRGLTTDWIEMSLLAALDPDIAKVYQAGSLDFDTLTPCYLLFIQRRKSTHGLEYTFMSSTSLR